MSKYGQNLRLYLHNYVTSTGEVSVKIESRFKKSDGTWKRKRESTNVMVLPKNWTGKHGKWVGRSDSKHMEKNAQLGQILSKYENAIQNDGAIELMQFIDKYIKLTEKAGRVTQRRIWDYKNTFTILQRFESSTNYILTYDSLNIEFISLFLEYLENNGHSQNNRRKVLKMLKHWLRASMEDGNHNNAHFKTRAWTVKEILSDEVYLNKEQIQKVIEVDLPDHLDLIRDCFVLGCNLGFRYSDLSNLDLSNIVKHGGRDVVRKTQSKTDELVVVPINAEVKRILDKHKGFPTFVNSIYFNRAIKKIIELAEVEHPEKVSSHTMRRSFATNAYLAGVPSISLMKVTGHKSESSFLRYIRISKEENARLLGDHPFFS